MSDAPLASDSCGFEIFKEADTYDKKTAPEFNRASGDTICPFCERKFADHPMAEQYLSFDGVPYLHRLCGDHLVKL